LATALALRVKVGTLATGGRIIAPAIVIGTRACLSTLLIGQIGVGISECLTFVTSRAAIPAKIFFVTECTTYGVTKGVKQAVVTIAAAVVAGATVGGSV
jgi:hypothetical protein